MAPGPSPSTPQEVHVTDLNKKAKPEDQIAELASELASAMDNIVINRLQSPVMHSFH